ncbi:hypothetical protein DL96DRAFT_745617 [Flagelloscypha sp. PMI_526]|nr:hypothetical protein DL96DRAFT_745617 [Flagelloscypha sp. PMI_526]
MESLPPLFPPELERQIFAGAATSTPSTRSALLLVARRVRYWIEPLRYSTLELGSYTSLALIQMLSQKNPDFLAAHVSVLLLNCYNERSWFSPTTHIPRRCTGVVDLTVIGNNSLAFDWNSYPNLRVLTLSITASGEFRKFLQDNVKFTLANLTHLEYSGEHLPTSETIVSQLPGLTHFMLVGWESTHLPQIQDYLLLQQIRRIVMLRVEEHDSHFPVVDQSIMPDDDRLVSVSFVFHSLFGPGERWRRRIFGGKRCDMWALAEQVAK